MFYSARGFSHRCNVAGIREYVPSSWKSLLLVRGASLFLYFDAGQLSVIERLLLSPLKNNGIAIKGCDVSVVRQNFMYGPLQADERCRNDWQDFNAVSDLETCHT